MDVETNTQAAIDAGLKMARPINLEPDTHDSPLQLVVVPEGCTLQSTESLIAAHREFPQRVIACPKFETLDSIIQYVGEFKEQGTQVFVTSQENRAPTVLAVIDYHDGLGDEVTPRWGSHKALYVSKFSVEWTRWTGFNGKKMNQAEFAALLEENASLIVSPPGAELLELVTTLEGHSDITCNQLLRLANGRTKLVYDENVTLTGAATPGSGAIEFPKELTALIQPFDGGPAYKIPCRLRYRIENRRLTFWFDCVDLHLVVKECVEAMVARIAEELKITPLMGSPS